MAEWQALNCDIPAGLHARMKVYAVKTRRKLKDFIREAIEEKLEREEVGTESQPVSQVQSGGLRSARLPLRRVRRGGKR